MYLTPTIDLSNTSTVEVIEIEESESSGENQTPPHSPGSRMAQASRLQVDDRSSKPPGPSPSLLRTAHDEQLEQKYFGDNIQRVENLDQRTVLDGHVRSGSRVYISKDAPGSDRRSAAILRTSTSADAQVESDDTPSSMISVPRGKGEERSSRGLEPGVFGSPRAGCGGDRAGREGASNSSLEKNAFHGNAGTPATFRPPTPGTSMRCPGSPKRVNTKVDDANYLRDRRKSPEAGREQNRRVSAGDASDDNPRRKAHRDRNKTLPSVKEVLTDRLNSQLNIDNHERFRRVSAPPCHVLIPPPRLTNGRLTRATIPEPPVLMVKSTSLARPPATCLPSSCASFHSGQAQNDVLLPWRGRA